MSAIVNDRDLLLQQPGARTGTYGAGLLLTGSTPVIHTDTLGANPAPTSVTLNVIQLATPGTVSWSITGGTLGGSGNTSRTLAAADMTGDVATITASVSFGGTVYSSSYAVAKVRDGKNGTNGSSGGTGARGAGTYYASGTAWDDAVADNATPGANVISDVVTISGSNFVMTKVWTGSAWVAQGTVIDGNLIVTGSVTTSKLNTNGLEVRDNLGNVILSANTALDWSRIAGASKPADNATRNTGLFANLAGQLTFSNAATYFAANAIDGTYIANLAADKIIAGTMLADRIWGGTLGGSTININSGAFRVDGVDGHAFAFKPLFTAATCSNGSATPSDPPLDAIAAGFSSVAAVRATNNGSAAGAHGVSAAGAAAAYDFYASGAGTNYGPFTGAHDVLWATVDDALYELGDLMADVECVARGGLSNTLFRVEPTSRPCQRAVVGALALRRGPLSATVPAVFVSGHTLVEEEDERGNLQVRSVPQVTPRYAEVRDLYQLGAVNALGEGQVNVCGEGGDLAAGDLIVASSRSGKGMRQADDLVRSYTVARAREAVRFATPDEVKLVACIYLGG